MRVKKDIKMLLLENDTSITDIAKEMSKRTGKHFRVQTFHKNLSAVLLNTKKPCSSGKFLAMTLSL